MVAEVFKGRNLNLGMERNDMRKVLMLAAAAAIALVGLSANTCGGGEEKQAAPEAPAPATPAEPPAAAPEAPAMAPEPAPAEPAPATPPAQ